MTVGNMERSIAFYSDVLGFEKVSDVEVLGEAYERLQEPSALLPASRPRTSTGSAT